MIASVCAPKSWSDVISNDTFMAEGKDFEF